MLEPQEVQRLNSGSGCTPNGRSFCFFTGKYINRAQKRSGNKEIIMVSLSPEGLDSDLWRSFMELFDFRRTRNLLSQLTNAGVQHLRRPLLTLKHCWEEEESP